MISIRRASGHRSCAYTPSAARRCSVSIIARAYSAIVVGLHWLQSTSRWLTWLKNVTLFRSVACHVRFSVSPRDHVSPLTVWWLRSCELGTSVVGWNASPYEQPAADAQYCGAPGRTFVNMPAT